MDFDWLWTGSASNRAAESARHFAWMASAHAFEFARAAERQGLADLSFVFEMAALEATGIEQGGGPRPRRGRAEPPSQREQKLPRWSVTRIGGCRAREVGIVHAMDAGQAVRIAIARFQITDPEKQRRLAARRIA
jgi:hypothetical protein